MKNLSKLEKRITRSISPENYTGAKGAGGAIPVGKGFANYAARDLGTGWKVNPFIRIQPGQTVTIAEIDGSGSIDHIWLTPTGVWRNTIIRMYWDHQENPSVECPIGDFFCAGWGEYHQISSLAVCVNPGSAFNCYWSMPFRKHCKITLTNIEPKLPEDPDYPMVMDQPCYNAEQPYSKNAVTMYYQIDYSLHDVAEDEAYFHAQFRRVNPLPYKTDYTILDGVKGKGKYVGTYMAWGVNNNSWWGEGEIKFYMDGDTDYPTICGTGTEDYFCGSYDFEDPYTHDRYLDFTTPYAGFHEITRDKLYRSQKRFGMYRFHITDPIYFEEELKVTIQALGWRSHHRYLPMQDDIASVAFWYQQLPTAPFPALPDKDYLEVI